MTATNVNANAKKVPAIVTNVERELLTLTFANGKSLSIDAGKLDGDTQLAAMMHGLKQKLIDAAAISCDPATGKPATVDHKYEAVKEVFDRLLAGEWNKKREAGTQSGGLLFRALVKMYDGRKSDAEIKQWLEGKTEAEKTALRKNEKVAEIIAELRAPASGGLNTDGLLAELDK